LNADATTTLNGLKVDWRCFFTKQLIFWSADVYYDILALLVQLESSHYSKTSEFKQNETRIAVLEAPQKKLWQWFKNRYLGTIAAPSMTMALENTFLKLIKENNYWLYVNKVKPSVHQMVFLSNLTKSSFSSLKSTSHIGIAFSSCERN
jgi:hypothetical protein